MDWNRTTALDALRNGDLLNLGMSANHMRCNLHPEQVVTYELCGRASSLEQAVSEAASYNGVDVSLEQILDTHSSLDALQAHLVAQRERLPEVTFQHLSVSSLKEAAGNLSALAKALPNLHAASLRSINIDFNAAQPSAISRADLAALLHAASMCDIFVAASITIGNAESLEQRIETLALLHAVQQEFNVIQAVQVRLHHATDAQARREEEATAVDYLKTLAVTRLLLHNIEHVQAGWSVMGPKVLELALRFGANDAGVIPWSQAGPEPSHHGGESELRRIIRDAGFQPVERDALFRQSLLH